MPYQTIFDECMGEMQHGSCPEQAFIGKGKERTIVAACNCSCHAEWTVMVKIDEPREKVPVFSDL